MSKVLELWQGMTGTVLPFAGAAAPAGWLLCDGATVSRTTYAALFAAIGTTYGAGDGATTFALPDLRGEFIRGLDGGRGVDTGRALGSAQAHAVQKHNHYLPTSNGGAGDVPNIPDATWQTGLDANVAPVSGKVATTVDVNGTQAGAGNHGTLGAWAAETRPRNVALNYIIRA